METLPRFAFRVNGSVAGGALSGRFVVRCSRVKLGFRLVGRDGWARVGDDGWCECECWSVLEGFR